MSDKPYRVNLANGSYILWDFTDGKFRVAFYNRFVAKSSDLEMTIANAMKKPIHDSKVKEITAFIKTTPQWEEVENASSAVAALS